MIDLHTHSSASDGTFSPSELVEYAAGKGLTTIALTDHDTVDGIAEAHEKALELGINFIPGIEISIEWPTGEFHLLGLGLQRKSPELAAVTDKMKEERKRRNLIMTEKLNEAGVSITYEEVVASAGTEVIGRPHFAKLLAEKKIVRNSQEAFNRFFANGRSCHVEKNGIDLEEAVHAIKKSGGIPVQAHPLSMYVSWGRLEDTIIEIQSMGVEGLEAWHPGTRISEAQRLEEMAHKLGMIATAGSDFHGEKVRADRRIGHATRGYRIRDCYWDDELKPALEKVHKGKDIFEF